MSVLAGKVMETHYVQSLSKMIAQKCVMTFLSTSGANVGLLPYHSSIKISSYVMDAPICSLCKLCALHLTSIFLCCLLMQRYENLQQCSVHD